MPEYWGESYENRCIVQIVNTVIEPGFVNTVTVVLGAKPVTKHAETGIAVSVT